MTNFTVNADQSNDGKIQLELSYEMHSDDVHWILKTFGWRSIEGLLKQPAFVVKGLERSSRITNDPTKKLYFPLNFISAVPGELYDKLNLSLQKKEQKTSW